MTPEGRVKEKVKKALAVLPQCYRFMPVQNGMGTPGLDFYTCIAGRFVAIETKTPGNHLTERQSLTAEQITQSGGIVFEVHDDADIAAMMANLWLMIEFDRECNRVAEASGRRRPSGGWCRDDVPERGKA